MTTPRITKNRKTRRHEEEVRKSRVEVEFEFTHPTAAAVFVAGTFNEWRPTATPMVPLGDGRWIKRLDLPPGRYEYRLVVDGEWTADPRAGDSAINPFGGVNSVLHVVAPD